MPTVSRFEELECWQVARELTRRAYALSRSGALSRDFGLRDQMRRAAVSVMSNISEGFESRTKALFVEFLGRAKGSAGELRAQLYVALDAEYLGRTDFDELFEMVERCSSQLSRLMSYLREDIASGRVRDGEELYIA
jgi:four helix bundle protein